MIPLAFPPEVELDQDRLLAAVEMVQRAAARSIELGWTDDAGPKPGDWYAMAVYKGARVIVEKQEGPEAAAEALAFKLMEGGECVHCGRLITIPGVKLRGGAPSCEYRREGAHWLRGCDGDHEAVPDEKLDRAARRRRDRARKKRGV